MGYTSINSVTPLTLSSFQGGNTLTAGVSVEHPIGERLSASFQYQHLHETYSGVAVITANPDSNREAVTLTYKLSRPLGR